MLSVIEERATNNAQLPNCYIINAAFIFMCLIGILLNQKREGRLFSINVHLILLTIFRHRSCEL